MGIRSYFWMAGLVLLVACDDDIVGDEPTSIQEAIEITDAGDGDGGRRPKPRPDAGPPLTAAEAARKEHEPIDTTRRDAWFAEFEPVTPPQKRLTRPFGDAGRGWADPLPKDP